MDKTELMEMVSAVGGDILGMSEEDESAGYVDMAVWQVELLVNAILERAAIVAENEPKVWDLDAPMPQVRIAMNIRALKTQGD